MSQVGTLSACPPLRSLRAWLLIGGYVANAFIPNWAV